MSVNELDAKVKDTLSNSKQGHIFEILSKKNLYQKHYYTITKSMTLEKAMEATSGSYLDRMESFLSKYDNSTLEVTLFTHVFLIFQKI